MRPLALLILLTACEAGHQPVTYPYVSPPVDTRQEDGASGCTEYSVDPDVLGRFQFCEAMLPHSVPLGDKCVSTDVAWKACKKVTDLACYNLKKGACILCGQPEP